MVYKILRGMALIASLELPDRNRYKKPGGQKGRMKFRILEQMPSNKTSHSKIQKFLILLWPL